jgi:membrane protein
VEITNRVIEFVDNMKVGVLGAVGLGMLVYTVISLMQKIENAFNFVWRVSRPRSFARRFGDYLSVILIGPVLAFSSLGATASLTTMNLGPLAAMAPFIKAVGALVPYLLIVVAFAFVYSFMPNTKVTLRAAVAGALVAGLLWNVAGWVFAVFVVGSTKYTAIYSAFATLIFFMIWLYLSWLIMLLGAAISFYVQHPEAVTIGRGEARPGGAAREALALGFALRIAEDHLRRRDGPTLDALAAEARVVPAAAAPVLAALERARIVVGTGDDPARYLPAGAIENIPVKAVLDAVREADAEGGEEAKPVARGERVAALMAELDRAAETALSGRSLRDMVGR